jgi:hypothetical protein
LSHLDIGRSTIPGNITEEPQSIRLMALLLLGLGCLKGPLAKRHRLRYAAGKHIALAQPHSIEGRGERRPDRDTLL